MADSSTFTVESSAALEVRPPWTPRRLSEVHSNRRQLAVNHIDFPQVTITAFTETGQTESSIKVPLQRSYIGTQPVISSTVANTPCATLGVPGLLDLFNSTLMTPHTLETPSLSSVLEGCIENNYDFGTAYGHLRAAWSPDKSGTILDNLRRRETLDREKRRKSIVGNRIVESALEHRRVWDLYANRVVPWSSVPLHDNQSLADSYRLCEDVQTACSIVRPISHAWMHAKDRVDVPIPKDASLDLIRIEMLNLGAEYAWLDVLCLRQKGGVREDLREEEWKLDVPTIGSVYHLNKVVVYLNGLGRPLSLKEGDLESDQCWFRRAWTVQEVGLTRIIAGDTLDGPFHAEPQDEASIGTLTKFHNQLQAVDAIHDLTQTLGLSPGMFEVLSVMQNRISTNPVDKVAGVASLLMSDPIPIYHETTSLEDAWTTLISNMTVRRDEGTDDDWCDEPCVEKGIVRALAARGAEQVSRRGELIVKDAEGVERTFGILARHGYPIPEGTYTLLVMNPHGPRRQRPMSRIFDHKPAQIQYWVIGRRRSDGKFEKVSVFEMDNEEEIKRLDTLGIFKMRQNILI
ncbi:hypothetical protein F5146DRAFT_1008068 [Armillaria mellea]|nr:hypothetical protein F5146DRAFT_1008068 [Armillaria mellea]